MIRFRFGLVPLDEVTPWGERKVLHWFGLTQGWYCIDIDGHELLRYSDHTMGLWRTDSAGARAHPWVDYYVVRLWEDVLEVLPHALEPVPEDLVEFMASESTNWCETDDPAADAALSGHADRTVDTGYLRVGPYLRWWREAHTEDTIVIAWRHTKDPHGEISFTAPECGRASVSTEEFVSAVTDFDRSLFDAMQTRVTQSASTGPRTDVELNVENLHWEHKDRRNWFRRALSQRISTDWDAVRAGARILSGQGVV
ncbi:DUF5984 family protein [Nocardia vinacea]|uniref:DUF5984 family protein n=1 Tax=Nocardia vinacea TaxID=96468 RepID=UPI0033DF7BBA